MSEPYQLYLLFSHGMEPRAAIGAVHDVLSRNGAVIDEDSLLILNGHDGDEPEPAYVHNPDEALATLAAWPALGSIDYMICDGMTTVDFKEQRGDVAAIELSVLVGAFERSEDHQQCYLRIATLLDQALQPARAVMQWGLSASDFQWEAEVGRVRAGQFEGTYDLLDVRRSGAEAANRPGATD